MIARRILVLAIFALAACESDQLSVVPPPIDSGVAPDTGVTTPDVGFAADTGPAVPPDAGFPPPAVEPVYIHTGDTLYSYDPADHLARVVGRFLDNQGGRVEPVVDIAIDLGGRMYGGTRDRKVFAIDPDTAACTYLFEFDDALNGLTFLSDGRLVVAGDRISIVHPLTGDMITELATDYETSGDIVGLPDGKLYWTVRNRSGDGDGLVRIDPISGHTDFLSEAGVTKIFGLGFAESTLYGFSDNGVVVTFDATTGRVLQERQLQGRWWGATTNPVLWE